MDIFQTNYETKQSQLSLVAPMTDDNEESRLKVSIRIRPISIKEGEKPNADIIARAVDDKVRAN